MSAAALKTGRQKDILRKPQKTQNCGGSSHVGGPPQFYKPFGMGVAAGCPVLDRSPTFDAGALPGARWTLCCFTYNGAIGKSPDAVNIAIFFAAAASFIPESTLFKNF